VTIQPQLALVTPAYNQAQFIADTVRSVLAQDVPVEYLVINDGSTDGTMAVLETFGDSVVVVSRENRGQTATINEGWRRTSAPIIGWLNSDDTLLPGAARFVLNFLNSHPDVDIVYGTTVFTDSEGRISGEPAGEPYDADLILRRAKNPIPQPSAFIRRRVLERVGYLNESLYYFMDWDFWLRSCVEHCIVHVDRPLSTYRLHGASKTVAEQPKVAPEILAVYEGFFDSPWLPTRILALKEESLFFARLASAAYLLHGGDAAGARRAAIAASRASPRLALRRQGFRQVAYCAAGASYPYTLLRRVLGRQASFTGYG
jgi:glycosyltransferase involved in cell wall biosynthesis